MTEAALLTRALLTGSLDELPEETSFLFARTGLLYVFSAAGFHLAAATRISELLSWPLRRLLGAGRAADLAALAVRFALLAWVALAAGGSAPMARAFTYVFLSAGARALELEADRRWLFLLSLLAGSVIGRASLFSFAFGALALGGALFVEPRRGIARLLGPWLFTLPLVAWRFGLVPLAGPLWSLSAGSLIGFFVLPAALAARLAESCGIRAPLLGNLAERGMELVTAALRTGDSAFGGALWVRTLPWALVTLALFAAFSLRARRPRAAALVAIASFAVALAVPLPSIAALDVGQGDGIFLRSAEGEIELEDVGPPGLHGREAPVCRGLERLGLGRLDHVLLSHFDFDHRGGLDSLLARHAVGALWFREEDLADKSHLPVLLAAERAGVPIRFVSDSRAPPGLRCRLAPFPNGNDSCPLCLASLAGGETALLTGDMSEKAEDWFVARLAEFPRARILKIAHHGSHTSSTAPFLAASGASTALVSVGARNRYGHPTREALERIERAGMHVRRTDVEGDVAVYAGWARPFAYFSALIEESMRPVTPVPREGSRVKPGRPATARWLKADAAFVK